MEFKYTVNGCFLSFSVSTCVLLKASGHLESVGLDGCLPLCPLLVSMERTGAFAQQQGRLVQGLVKLKNCEAQGCSTQPSFGFPGEKPRRCKAHAQTGMVSFTTRKADHSSLQPSNDGIHL